MSSEPRNTPTQTHIAGPYVDACRHDVHNVMQRLRRPRAARAMEKSLHRSVSILLQREVRRLTHHAQESRVLPEELHTMVGAYKASVETRHLERLIERRASQWRSAVIELLKRLERDWRSLVETFGLAMDEEVMAISTTLGDQHAGGRAVFALTFEGGARLVYKPRNVGGEYTFGKVVQWVENGWGGPTLMTCRVLEKNGYGWTNYVVSEFSRNTDEALSFYERQGAFLALFYILCGTDCTGENVVIVRDHPVWIDTECLCTPIARKAKAVSHVPSWMEESVLATHLVFHGNDMGWSPRTETGLAVSCLADRSLVFTDGDVLKDVYIDAVKRGFRKFYERVLIRKVTWTSKGGPLSWFSYQRLRMVPRPTALYVELADALSIAPRGMEDGIRNAVVRVLRSWRGDSEFYGRLVAAELKAMGRGDIPYWYTTAVSRDLAEGRGTVLRRALRVSGLACVHERASRMSVRDLENQLWLLETFLRVRGAAWG